MSVPFEHLTYAVIADCIKSDAGTPKSASIYDLSENGSIGMPRF